MVLANFSAFKMKNWHSEPMAQLASFSKKLQKLIILDSAHIFLFPIQGKGKIARGIRIWTEKIEKGFSQTQTIHSVVLTTEQRYLLQKFIEI
jgi:hypothetical protein